MDDLWSALEGGEVDVVILSEQTSLTGWGAIDERVAPPGSGLFVHSATTVAYHCSLYAKGGTRLSDIEGVYGHGSIHQCRPWLDANLPGIPTLVHEHNSVAAAREVAASDGRRAVVSTRLTGESAGLIALADDIDGGALGWWAVTTRPWFAADPDHTFVTVPRRSSGRTGRRGGGSDEGGGPADLGLLPANQSTTVRVRLSPRVCRADLTESGPGRSGSGLGGPPGGRLPRGKRLRGGETLAGGSRADGVGTGDPPKHHSLSDAQPAGDVLGPHHVAGLSPPRTGRDRLVGGAQDLARGSMRTPKPVTASDGREDLHVIERRVEDGAQVGCRLEVLLVLAALAFRV